MYVSCWCLFADERVDASAPVPNMTEDGEYVEEDFPDVQITEMLNALSLEPSSSEVTAEQQLIGQQMQQFEVRDMVDDMNMHMEH